MTSRQTNQIKNKLQTKVTLKNLFLSVEVSQSASYIHTKQGVLYLSMIKDLYDNFIVAYDTSTTQDNALVYRTIKYAKKEVADNGTDDLLYMKIYNSVIKNLPNVIAKIIKQYQLEKKLSETELSALWSYEQKRNPTN